MAGTVTIACKLPHGLRLRLHDWAKGSEPVMGGGTREFKIAVPLNGPEVVINGFSHPQNAAPSAQMVGGFALTPNVDKDFWDKWLSQNKDADYVKNHLIFAHEKSNSAEAEAKEKKDIKSGLERLDRTKAPKGVAQATAVA